MPKKAIDYSKTIIYKIICKDDNIKDIYIGHTTNFIKRKNQHKFVCNDIKNKNYNLKIYQTIREHGNIINWDILPIEEYTECQSLIQACIREQYWMDKHNSNLNMMKAREDHTQRLEKKREYYQAKKEEIREKNREYRITNENKIKAQKQDYYLQNKETIKEKRNNQCLCSCGKSYTHNHKKRHERSKFHLNYILNKD